MTRKSIYRIIDAVSDKTLSIASTSLPLSVKLSELKQNYKKSKGCKKYQTIFHDHGIENLEIELLESFEYDRIEELRKKDNEYRRSYNIKFKENMSDVDSTTTTATPLTGAPNDVI